ncbi:MAG: hypothetical protein ACRC80_27240 [Waterburya sp.]
MLSRDFQNAFSIGSATFQYQDLAYTPSATNPNPALKNYFSQHLLNPVRTRVFKTPTGVSVFFPGDNLVAFGSGNGSTTNQGLIRFEIRPDGTEFIDFIPRTALAGFTLTFGSVVAVYGDRVYVNVDATSSSIVRSLGVINGLNYVVGNFGNGQTGFPVNVSSTDSRNEITKETEPNNFYFTGVSSQKKNIYYESKIIESYFADRIKVESREDITLRPSLLDPYVRLSPHTAPDILCFMLCACV